MWLSIGLKKKRKKVVGNMLKTEPLGYVVFFFFSFIQPGSVELVKQECLYMTNTSQRPSTDRSHWVELCGNAQQVDVRKS